MFAQSTGLDTLFDQLRDPRTQDWEAVEEQIWSEWSDSGSPSVDLLLERGRAALEAGDTTTAIEHFTALTDHAPDFAEGWNGRAMAFYAEEKLGPAMSDLERVLALNPRHFGAMTGLAQILVQLGYEKEAISVYRAVHAIHPHQPDIKDALERLEQAHGGSAL
ncbi:tetratricopeptide repeat protein [Qingshengfaniella alkalisoli]|uniref:tetratricopeptide repeat protein n=1 Tax=Qingshengfaniella alkalisoli TaxID=2599296 RepID=UPI001F0FA9F7|nr:tetratricopeptide repeat protein [Qingshengfaniella alkalisoli]